MQLAASKAIRAVHVLKLVPNDTTRDGFEFLRLADHVAESYWGEIGEDKGIVDNKINYKQKVMNNITPPISRRFDTPTESHYLDYRH